MFLIVYIYDVHKWLCEMMLTILTRHCADENELSKKHVQYIG